MDAGSHDKPPPRDGRGNHDSFGAGPPHNQPFVQGSRGGSRPPPNVPQRGRYAQPDHNKGKWDPNIICDACCHTGHVAANCDMLAMAVFLEKYKREMSDELKDKLESAWLEHWKRALGNPSWKPCHVMKAYLDFFDMLINDLDEQMCWECWPDDNDDNNVAVVDK
jgi:hypothetical protein